MVRLLLSSVFLMSCWASAQGSANFPHNSVAGRPCAGHLESERHFNLSSLKALRRLQREVSAQFPIQKFAKIAVGRAVAPLTAALQSAGDPTLSLPLELNLHKTALTEMATSQLRVLLNSYLPLSYIRGKTVVVVIYAEKPEMVKALHGEISNYVQEAGIASKVLMYVVTSQLGSQEMKADLDSELGDANFKLRPLAAAHDLRSWFHDGLTPGGLHYSPYPVVNVFQPSGEILIRPEAQRKAYMDLVMDLARSAP